MRTYGEPVIAGAIEHHRRGNRIYRYGLRILADEVVDFSFDELDMRLSAVEGTAN